VGGYGGITVAKALDETSDVVLGRAKGRLQANIAALRALVDPSWLSKIFLPYAGLLTNGRRRSRPSGLGRPTPRGDGVGRGDLRRLHRAGYRIEVPLPGKTDLVETHHAQEQVRQTHRATHAGGSGPTGRAGPVGIELAGEITCVWPEKSIILLDVADEILGGPLHARAQGRAPTPTGRVPG